MSKNIRRHERVSFPGVVRLCWKDSIGNDKVASGRCIDMSVSGLRLEVPEALVERSYVSVKADSVGFAATASVRHCVRARGKFIVGLEFSSPLNASNPKVARLLGLALDGAA